MKGNPKTYLVLIIIFLLMINNHLHSQIDDTRDITEIGVPIIKSYTPNEYGAHSQNWAIVQDKKGIMYFGNTDGLLEYDGVSWRLISIPNQLTRSLAVSNETENGVIYIGGIDEFGYLAPDESGTLEYKSLKEFLPKDENNIGNVWNTIVSSDAVYFQTNSHLIRWDFHGDEKNTDKLKVWKANTLFNYAFIVDDQLYINEAKIGLSSLIEDTLRLIPNGKIFAQAPPFLMLPYLDSNEKRKILIGTRRKGFYLFNGLSLSPFKTDADEYVRKNQLYLRGAVLADSTIALGTNRGGVVIINTKGKLLQFLNKSMGLKSNTIRFIYPDKQNNLWLATENGIEKVMIPSGISVFNELNNLEGNIHKIIRHMGKLYVGTSLGVYYLNKPELDGKPSKFKLVEGILVQSGFLFSTGRTLFAATQKGIYIIEEGGAKLIKSDWSKPYCIYQSRKETNKIYVGISDGLALLQYKDGKWINSGRIDGISETVRSIEEGSNGDLWLGTHYQGVLKVKVSSLNDRNKKVQIEYFSDHHNLPEGSISVVNINNKILFTTNNGLRKFDTKTNMFIPDSTFGILLADTNTSVNALHQDANKNVWISAINNNEKIFGVAEKQENGSYLWENHPHLLVIMEINNKYLDIYSDINNINLVWIAITEVIISYNYKRNYPIGHKDSYHTLIRKVVINNDSIIFGGNPPTTLQFNKTGFQVDSLNITQLTHKDKSISFEYATTSFLNESKNQYQYYLENFDKSWSSWTKETRKEYTNTPPGDYHFRVRAIDIFDNISNEATFSFTVLSPWYQTWWAYLIYIAVIGLVFLRTVKWRVRYLERERDKLEATIADRTNEVTEQAKKLKELDHIKSHFFANISHEFRTPLTLILGQSDSLLSQISKKKNKDKLHMILRNGKMLLNLINQLLDISKIEAGSMELKAVHGNLIPFLKSLIFLWKSLADQKQVELQFQTDQEEIELYFDPEKLEKVFYNLLSNAFKFTQAGGVVKVDVNCKQGIISTAPVTVNLVEITVKDTGVGIPADQLPNIFNRFYQADSSHAHTQEGTGIGLSLTKELIEIHYGEISVESKQDEGTTFKVRLLRGDSHLKKGQIIDIKDEDKKHEFKEINIVDFDPEPDALPAPIIDKDPEIILIVEDHPDVRSYICGHLDKSYKLIVASDGEDGLARAKETIPDLIITDIMMPKMDGYQLSSILKNDEVTSHIPIIMLTAKATIESKIEGLETGADDYLTKPFSPKELQVRVRNLIELRKRLRERFSEAMVIKPSDVTATSVDKVFLEKVISSIENHISDELFGLETLAAEVSMSVTHINRKLNALIGQPAGQLIRNMRLQRAVELLKKNAGTASEIAYMVGFSNPSGFSKSFKKKFGCSPIEYKTP